MMKHGFTVTNQKANVSLPSGILKNEEKPTKLRRSSSVGKKMVATFFCRSGHVVTVPLQDRRTVTAEWYSTVCLPKVVEKMKELRSRSRLLFHHDIASSYTAL